MGYQQIFFIAIGILAVISVLAVGLQLMSSSIDEQIKDSAILRFHEIGMMANKYRMTAADMSGRGGSYIGFKTENRFKNDELSGINKLWPKKNIIDIYLITNIKSSRGKPYFIWGRYNPEGLEWISFWNPDTRKWNKFFDSKSGG